MSEPRNGALSFMDEDGVRQWANPGTPLFSSVTMSATHFYRDGVWEEIYPTSGELTIQQSTGVNGVTNIDIPITFGNVVDPNAIAAALESLPDNQVMEIMSSLYCFKCGTKKRSCSCPGPIPPVGK